MKNPYWLGIIVIILLVSLLLFFNKNSVYTPIETIVFNDKLSDYALFEGEMSDLKPSSNLEIYELSSELFTDYADKQRMILLPQGKKMIAKNDGLPDFPEGTIIVKTFYYKNHIDDGDLEQRVLETRLLIKNKSVWNAATYRWNVLQNEALLSESGTSIPINFVDSSGNERSTTYQIPAKTDCTACHKQDSNLSPLGPKIRNLNFDIVKNSLHINQLDYLVNHNMLERFSGNFSTTPDYTDENLNIEKRARAYFDMNCAHCHSDQGETDYMRLDLSLNTPFDDSDISRASYKITSRMKITGALHMPKTGTSINHDEGIKLIRDYIESLSNEK